MNFGKWSYMRNNVQLGLVNRRALTVKWYPHLNWAFSVGESQWRSFDVSVKIKKM